MDNYTPKNTKPAVMTDNGPYGTTRPKSDDGQYTANNAYSGTEAEKEEQLRSLNSTYPQLNERQKARSTIGFDTKALDFDNKICTPVFKAFAKTSIGKILGTENFQTATSYEDQTLKIDVFAGDPDPKYAFLLCDPNVKKIDLKTEKGYLGIAPGSDKEKEFMTNPTISLSVRKVIKREYGYQIKNQISKGFNSHYAFNIISSPKQKRDITRPGDINKGILFYVNSEDTHSFINENGGDSIDDFCGIIQKNEDDSFSAIQEKFDELAQAKGLIREKEPVVNNRMSQLEYSDLQKGMTMIFTREEDTRYGNVHWNVLFRFPAKGLLKKPSGRAWKFGF